MTNESDEGFDAALELAGSWCRWQKRIFVIASCSQIFSAIHAILAVFLSFTPDHWCHVESLEKESGVLEVDKLNQSSIYYLRNITIPRYGDEWAKCEYYNHSYTSLLNHHHQDQHQQQDLLLSGTNFTHSTNTNNTLTTTASCNSWVYDDSVFTSTLVTEFNLVCDRRWMMATVQASYMSGLLIGSLVMGQLSDRVMPESPRWLASQQREEEAVKILQDIAKTNGRTLPSQQHLIKLVSTSYHKKTRGDYPDDITRAKYNNKRRHWYDGVVECARSQLTLVRTPIMRRRALICFYLWFAAASVYYGLIFSGGNIKADPFLMILISGLVELPSSAIFIHPIKKFGRRAGTCGMFMASALCLFAILAVPEDMTMVNICLVNLGKFFTTPVFQLQYVYTSELFPTTVRNMAVGTCSMVARIGCVITPYILTLLGDVHYALPSTVFAVFAMSAGLLTLLLPETTNALLPETTEEIEAMIK
ncbi:hypothetical protein Pmani_012560 [Petrolisthes manimaculis]|uniref:Uncharacterized protein n=1 Tax=Petrolisthes manimaculis TaxID=1843537 RepID=A0AAE1Q079_9EUCA|nr:hypothetical protein Pmani_012560 [Petrolisthes manimaculis]